MYIRRVLNAFEMLTPAKLNLFFEVLARRDDRFHEIETLMTPVDCFDTLSVENDPAGHVSLTCRTAERNPQLAAALGEVPTDGNNIVIKAVNLLRSRANVQFGARLRLTKRIPAMAGLGGGSSDAAAALVGANLAWKLGWSRRELSKLAAELGSDVPFFLTDGAAICRGRGEQIEPLPDRCPMAVVIVRPPVGLATPLVYQNCQVGSPAISILPMIEAMRRGDIGQIARHLHNRLEAAATILSPWISRLRSAFDRLGCLGHQMSGSGTSYFGICRNMAHARRAAARLRASNLGWTMAAQCG